MFLLRCKSTCGHISVAQEMLRRVSVMVEMKTVWKSALTAKPGSFKLDCLADQSGHQRQN